MNALAKNAGELPDSQNRNCEQEANRENRGVKNENLSYLCSLLFKKFVC